jgi:hypothetical protein
MVAAYLIAAITGGTLLIASLLTGHHGGGHELDHSGAPAHDHAGHGSGIAGLVLSVRFWTYLFAFGGGTGLLLRLLAHLGEPLALLLSLGVGAASGAAVQIVMDRLSQEAGGVVASRELVYKLGTMLLPAAPGQSSRVRVTINNQTVDLIAVTDDISIAAREEVLILDVKDGVAHVTRNVPAGEKP